MLLALFLFLAPDLSQQPSATLAGFVHLVRGVGSPARSTAYPDLASALAAAVDGDFLILDPGLYTGPANRDLVVTKDVVIRGRYGPDTSIIDCEGLGRAFDFQGARALVEGLKIQGGQATTGGGARVSGGTVLFKSVVFERNFAVSGGALSGDHSSAVFLSECLLRQNYADLRGGGFYAEGLGLLASCQLEYNSAAGHGGGLLASSSISSVQAFDCTFQRNSSPIGAGAATFFGNLTLDRCSLVENQSNGVGGGAAMVLFFGSSGGTLTVTNSLILRNDALNGGGAIYGGPAGISNCTVVGNTSPSAAPGGIWTGNRKYPSVIFNSLIRGNSSSATTLLGQQVQDTGTFAIPPDLTLLYSNVEGITGSPTNFDAKPLFLDPANGDYHIAPSSPCVDAGFTYSLTNSQRDIDGEMRFQGASVDIGADEVPAAGGP